MGKSILAWHFVRGPAPGVLRDGRPVVVRETVCHDGALVLCESGLHASVRLIDALGYSPGSVICRVRVGGEIVKDHNKLVASERTVLWSFDAEAVLRAFAHRCALDVVHLWPAPEIVVRYLRTGDESIRDGAGDAARSAARSVAGDAAGAAAWDAAWATVRAAAGAAAGAAAWAAAGDAAWAAAWAAARDAAGDAARTAQERRLTRMIAAARRE